ncbi:hypothetical protein X975_04236, partial [Stegodyphus mimosarum]
MFLLISKNLIPLMIGARILMDNQALYKKAPKGL